MFIVASFIAIILEIMRSFAAPLHNQHNAATTPLLAAVNKVHSTANRAVNKLTGNSSSSRGAVDGGHSPSPDFTNRYLLQFQHKFYQKKSANIYIDRLPKFCIIYNFLIVKYLTLFSSK